MPQGRNHQQRELHVRAPRTRSMPASTDRDLEVPASGRKRVTPREGIIGSHKQRRLPSPPDMQSASDREQEPVDGGSEYAPTAKAQERERERHARERQIGRVAAGTQGRVRGTRSVDRKKLAEAARAADEKVGVKAKLPNASSNGGERSRRKSAKDRSR